MPCEEKLAFISQLAECVRAVEESSARLGDEAGVGEIGSQEWTRRVRMARAQRLACIEMWSKANQALQNHQREHGCF